MVSSENTGDSAAETAVVARRQPSREQPAALVVDLALTTDENLIVDRVDIAPLGLVTTDKSIIELALPDDRVALSAAIDRSRESGSPQHLTIAFDTSSSELLAVRVSPSGIGRASTINVTGIKTGERRARADDAQSSSGQTPQTDPLIDELRIARTMLNIVPCAVFIKDADARFINANHQLLQTLGFSSVAELYGKTDFDVHPASEAEVYLEIDRQIIRTGEPIYDLVESQTRSDGSVEVVRTTKLPIRNSSGDIVGLMGYSADVTEPTRVSEALRNSEQRYALAAQATRDGIWDYDMVERTLSMTPRCAQLLDIPVDNQRTMVDDFLDQIGEDNATMIVDQARMLRSDPGQRLDVDFPIVLSDGTSRWISIVGMALRTNGVTTKLVGSVADVTIEHQREQQLRFQARHDDLTGLANRRALMEAIATRPGSLLYLDLDSFKVINDSLGHQAGDEMLRAVTSRLRGVIDADATFARLGGDEFAILLTSNTAERALQLADELQEAISTPFKIWGLEMYTTASIGIVTGESVHKEPDEVFRDADIALYVAKASGKRQAVLFEPSMRKAADHELDKQMRIRRAVDEMEFVLHYQPVVDSVTGALRGFEALVRWDRPGDPLAFPSSFLPYLEETSLIIPVGSWVIDEGCRQLAAWRKAFPQASDLYLALNVSRVQFNSPCLVQQLRDSLATHGLSPADIVIEVTETAVTDRPEQLKTQLREIQALGLRVAVDDFGVGQSALSVLPELPVDILKIDRSFVNRIVGQHDEPLTSTVLALAKSLGLQTVGEGVEQPEQAAWLAARGCDTLQGYFVSKPLAAEQVPELFDGDGIPLPG